MEEMDAFKLNSDDDEFGYAFTWICVGLLYIVMALILLQNNLERSDFEVKNETKHSHWYTWTRKCNSAEESQRNWGSTKVIRLQFRG